MIESARRFVLPVPQPAQNADAIVRAFLWLKRRIEEGQTSGILAIPSNDYLDHGVAGALGWRLTDVLREEGNLPLGDGLCLSWLSAIDRPRRGPIAALFPDPADLAILARWPGLALVVPDSKMAWNRWTGLTRAAEPPPENYGGRKEAEN